MNYNFYNIIKFKKDITEKVCLVDLHGLAAADAINIGVGDWTLLTVSRALCASTGGPHPAGRSVGYNLKSRNYSAIAPADTIIADNKKAQ